jgi:hypothetical protein
MCLVRAYLEESVTTINVMYLKITCYFRCFHNNVTHTLACENLRELWT